MKTIFCPTLGVRKTQGHESYSGDTVVLFGVSNAHAEIPVPSVNVYPYFIFCFSSYRVIKRLRYNSSGKKKKAKNVLNSHIWDKLTFNIIPYLYSVSCESIEIQICHNHMYNSDFGIIIKELD